MICSEIFNEWSESLVQPQVVPPAHSDQITEPLEDQDTQFSSTYDKVAYVHVTNLWPKLFYLKTLLNKRVNTLAVVLILKHLLKYALPQYFPHFLMSELMRYLLGEWSHRFLPGERACELFTWWASSWVMTTTTRCLLLSDDITGSYNMAVSL